MPTGNTHDAITFISTLPVFFFSWSFAGFMSAAVVTTAFIVGGFVFGPDLDTASKQYQRWGLFRFLWFPYNQFFSHRSRWSHGLIFGTFIRVVYFVGVFTLFSFFLAYLNAVYAESQMPNLMEFIESWKMIGDLIRKHLGDYAIFKIFIGLWAGAASHTLTDIAVTYIKTGRIKGLL